MHWSTPGMDDTSWHAGVDNFDAKSAIAHEMAARLRDGEIVGVGSGSTSLVTLHALAGRAREGSLRFVAITSSVEMEVACATLGVGTTSLIATRPDWSFDGADEVDDALDMIKGRGGALLRERLLIAASPERYVVADRTKRVARLGTRAPIPLELVPEALNLVRAELADMAGVREMQLRLATGKDGPTMTEHGNVILDVRFDDVTPDLDARLRSLPGVVATGLFIGYHPTIVSD